MQKGSLTALLLEQRAERLWEDTSATTLVGGSRSSASLLCCCLECSSSSSSARSQSPSLTHRQVGGRRSSGSITWAASLSSVESERFFLRQSPSQIHTYRRAVDSSASGRNCSMSLKTTSRLAWSDPTIYGLLIARSVPYSFSNHPETDLSMLDLQCDEFDCLCRRRELGRSARHATQPSHPTNVRLRRR